MSLIVYVHSLREMQPVEIIDMLRHFDYSDDVLNALVYDANVNIAHGEGFFDHVFLLRPKTSLGEMRFRVISELPIPQPSKLVESLDVNNAEAYKTTRLEGVNGYERSLVNFLGEHCAVLAGHVIKAVQKGDLAHFELSGDPTPYFNVFADTRRKLLKPI